MPICVADQTITIDFASNLDASYQTTRPNTIIADHESIIALEELRDIRTGRANCEQ